MYTASGRPTMRSLKWELRMVNGPSAEPMHVNDAKDHLRRGKDITSEDALLKRYIESARDKVESDTSRAICWQRWKLTLDQFPDVIDIYKCPVLTVDSIKYQDSNDVQQMLASSVYKVSYTEPCRIQLAANQQWPIVLPEIGSIEITFTCGYLTPFTADSTTDLLTFTDYSPTNGDSFRLTNSGGELPGGLQEKRTYYVVNASGTTCKLSATSGGSAIDITSKGGGLHYLGECSPAIVTAMRKRIAVEFADREGSESAAKCEESYVYSLTPCLYTSLRC